MPLQQKQYCLLAARGVLALFDPHADWATFLQESFTTVVLEYSYLKNKYFSKKLGEFWKLFPIFELMVEIPMF